MNEGFDWITTLLGTLLLATLIGFFTGVFPYPYGALIITGLLLLRLRSKSRPD